LDHRTEIRRRAGTPSPPRVERFFETQILHSVLASDHENLSAATGYSQCPCAFCTKLAEGSGWDHTAAAQHDLYALASLTRAVAGSDRAARRSAEPMGGMEIGNGAQQPCRARRARALAQPGLGIALGTWPASSAWISACSAAQTEANPLTRRRVLGQKTTFSSLSSPRYASPIPVSWSSFAALIGGL
jgi:hypothetical protein